MKELQWIIITIPANSFVKSAFFHMLIFFLKWAYIHDDFIKWKHYPCYWPLSLLRLNKRLNKSETPSCSLWRHSSLLYNADIGQAISSRLPFDISGLLCLTWWKAQYTWAGGYKVKFMLNSMLVNKDFLTWFLIGWRLCCQSIRCHFWKSLLMNIYFNMKIS